MAKKFLITIFCFLCACLFLSGGNGKGIENYQVIVNKPTENGTIGSIDLRTSFFWILRSWKEDTLVTIDGNARFAEMSFYGRSGVRIKPLVNYPRMPLDRTLIAYPEYGLLISKSARRFHVADITTKKTKSFVPYLTGKHLEYYPMLIDGNEGLLLFPYIGIGYGIESPSDTNFFVMYNYKTDTISEKLGETNEDRILVYPLDSENLIGFKNRYPLPREVYIYNWRTGEQTENELTRTLTRLDVNFTFEPRVNISLKKRFMFIELNSRGERSKWAKITWEEGYKEVKVIPIDYLTPVGRWLNDFFLSPDEQWATLFIGGYREISDELLEKRVFFHLDDRYPNGISMPVFADGYYEYHWEQGAFVKHPVYGMCFAEKVTKGGIIETDYLRLHKMSDVLAEINRQLLENAEGATND